MSMDSAGTDGPGVLIADDQTLFRSGLVKLLEADARVTVVGEARDGQQAIEMVSSLPANVVLMDLKIPQEPRRAATATDETWPTPDPPTPMRNRSLATLEPRPRRDSQLLLLVPFHDVVVGPFPLDIRTPGRGPGRGSQETPRPSLYGKIRSPLIDDPPGGPRLPPAFPRLQLASADS